MSKLRDALSEWEERENQRAIDAETIKLNGWLPPIERIDSTLVSTLKKCKCLSLSTNNIRKIDKLDGMESLQILSLGRNMISKIENLSSVAGTLQQLWISYNKIDSLLGIEVLQKLRVLYMNANTVSEWQEFELLQTLPNLQELTFAGNPLEVATGENWRVEVLKRLPNLKKLDGVDVTEQELSQARRQTEKKVQFVSKDQNSDNEQPK